MTGSIFKASVLTGVLALGLISPRGSRYRFADEEQIEGDADALLFSLCQPRLSARPFFGDTHLRPPSPWTLAPSARLGPREAYRFARGEQLTASSGRGEARARSTSL